MGYELDSNTIHTFTVAGATLVEKTLADMLNRTVLLNEYGHEDSVYFVKSGGFSEENVSKLKKYLNIKERNIEPHGTELCIQASETQLCGLSGVEAVEEGQFWSERS